MSKFGWDLPPGCSQRQIDEHFGSICADEFEWHCTMPDCTEHSHDSEDFLKCEACHELACMEHSRYGANDTLHRFCEACFVCSQCGKNAKVLCEECGSLLCAECAAKVAEPVDDWNVGDIHFFCRGVCRTEQRKPVMREEITERKEVIGQ